MDLINTLLIFVSCILAIPTLVFAMQVLLARVHVEPVDDGSGLRPSVAVLMPAHNEARVIEDTLASIMPQLWEKDRVIVVADNCSDNTAALAAKMGAIVIERQDEVRRGKGYALDFGLRFLADNKPPQIVVVIDADCQLAPASLDTLARRADKQNRPVQALYLMEAPKNHSLSLAIAEFAWRVKNQVRPLGMLGLRLPCQLMGTGMAFRWTLLQQADLAHGNMVEDMKLGIDLALRGFPPVFCPDALVTSEFPTSEQVSAKQRTRWEHGHLAMILAGAPQMFKVAIQQRNLSLLAMALDLGVPPLSALGLALVFGLLAASLFASVSDAAAAFWIMAGMNGIFAVAVLHAWYSFGREILALKTLCVMPLYMLRKIPLYLAFVMKRQQGWVKTERR